MCVRDHLTALCLVSLTTGYLHLTQSCVALTVLSVVAGRSISDWPRASAVSNTAVTVSSDSHLHTLPRITDHWLLSLNSMYNLYTCNPEINRLKYYKHWWVTKVLYTFENIEINHIFYPPNINVPNTVRFPTQDSELEQ